MTNKRKQKTHLRCPQADCSEMLAFLSNRMQADCAHEQSSHTCGL